MTAIITFKKTLARANALITLHTSLSPAQLAAMPTPNDLLRSAVALSIAGMDTYFTDRFAESLVRFLKKHGAKPDLVALLFDAGLDTKASLEMLTMQRPYRRIRTLVEAYLSNYTTQKQHVIDKLFLVYGIKGLCSHAEKHSKKKKLLTNVNAAVLRRHSIVHAGDLNSHNNPRPIDNKLANRYIDNVDTFVTNAEAILVKALKI
ncbi:MULTISPECIES: hypothetical protein [Chromobacterium]|uniref:hypothetical protein n=1 Tax=Chromobacterium TaxID=535 RepID=UPI0018896BA4|nr:MULTISPECIES: hypothetical protein [Chromobacterium]WON85232.1 hypothetical protein OK026_06935 [Chromobacterium haemolyticum]